MLLTSIHTWVFSHLPAGEGFWVALGSLVTAVALVYTITTNTRSRHKAKYNACESLRLELITNFNTVFRDEVDRPLLFDAIRNLRRNYAGEINNFETFSRIQNLYLKLEQYSKFVEKVWLTNSNVDRLFVTEQQVQACNAFLTYFGHKQVDYDANDMMHALNSYEYIEAKRDKLRRIQNRNIKTWKAELQIQTRTLLR